MIIQADLVPRDSQIDVDVCIVGSGAAGIPLALSLCGQGLKVLILESGQLEKDPATQVLYEGEVADENLHSLPVKYRQRRFGGSTTIWGGRCMPFNPIDFERREYVPLSGWPITYSDILPYYINANEWLEAGKYLYDADVLFDAEKSSLFRDFKGDAVRTNSLERFSCPTNLAVRYFRRLELAEDLKVILGANCNQINLNKSGKRVESVDVVTLEGNRFSVSSKAFVLATGGIEVPRILLASNKVVTSGIGNEFDLVGRYYQCHIAANIGQLTIKGPTKNVRHGYEVSPDGVYCRRRLSIDEEVQRSEGLLNMVARLHFSKIVDPEHSSGVLSSLFFAKRFISYEYGKRLNDGQKIGFSAYVKHLLNIVLDPPETISFLMHWVTKRSLVDRKFPSVILKNKRNLFSLEVHSEQSPNYSSRISLLDSKDALGMPKVKVDWQFSPQDIDSVRRTLNIFKSEIENSGIGAFEFNNDTLQEDLLRFGAYGGHHIGTTRMGIDPKTSVVDKNCRIHSVENLYVASSSVFPTSSQANPTLTITAIALRLSDHLANLLRVK
jgi:choline dehydrogenase-like flavoprotein